LSDDVDTWRGIGLRLRDEVLAALPGWLHRQVRETLDRQAIEHPPDLAETIADAADRASRFVGPRLTELVNADPDEARGTPLSVLRGALRFPTEVLDAAGASPVRRDDMARWSVPEDRYDLCPANLGDLSPEAFELGIAWGAGKAHIHLQRHRPT